MRLRRTAVLALLCILAAHVARAQEERELQGRVVDEHGQPVAGVDVSSFWGANGTRRNASGQPLKLPADVQEYWAHVGEMEPQFHPGKSAADGKFSIRTLAETHHVMALDSERKRGGIAVFPKGHESEPIEISLGPLVKVRGRFAGTEGKPLPWSHASLNLPTDPTRPLDHMPVAFGGSHESRFEFLVPAGRYVLEFTGHTTPAVELNPSKMISLTLEVPEVDLGVLRLSAVVRNSSRKDEAKASGRWADTNTLYGRPSPDWQASDARGIDKQARPADFRGKWVLLKFWGTTCTPCLRSGLPRLQKFDEEHAKQRLQFEIITICLDPEGELKSMADLDRVLEPIVKHVWNGKRLSLPVLLDSSFTTWERFGLNGMGQTMLIDPDGNLREGDEETLDKLLK